MESFYQIDTMPDYNMDTSVYMRHSKRPKRPKRLAVWQMRKGWQDNGWMPIKILDADNEAVDKSVDKVCVRLNRKLIVNLF